MWRQASGDVEFHSVSDDPWRWDHYTEEWPPRNLTQRTKRVGEITLRLVDYGDDREIYARIGDRVVGTAYFGYVGADLRAAVQVDPKYRRRGVATAMYVWAEEIARDKLTPDIPHTPLAEALWNQPNRPFGRTASASGLRFETETIINNSVIRLAAYDGDTVVGFLAWDVRFEPGMILSISVDPGYQRRGIATELWNRARVIEPRLHHSDDVTDEGQAWIRSLGAMKDVAYRGVSLQLDARRGVPILEALAKRQTNVAARLIIDAMAETVKDHWWAAGAQESDEAGRWWTSRKGEAEIYAMGTTDAWMTLPVVMTASFEGAESTGYNDGTYVWHLQAGHPVTITEFEAMLPDDPQALLDGWRGVTSPGNHDAPSTYWDGTWTRLSIPPMRTTASGTTTMYRGVPAYLSPERKREYIAACRDGKTRVMADLLMEVLAEQSQNKNRWWGWGAEDDVEDEAGRWWAASWFDAWGFGRGDGADDGGRMMIVPVVLRAEIENKYVQGGFVAHVPAGTPLVIDRVQAPIIRADDKRRPKTIIGDPGSFVVLPIPPMRTTAGRH